MRFIIYLFVLSGLIPAAARAEPITELQLREHIDILASEEFEGRKPGTTGENKTVNYIATRWHDAGLKPAAGDRQWYAPVTLVERKPVGQSVSMRLTTGKRKKLKVDEDELILRGSRQSGSVSNAEIVFAGYGHQNAELLTAVDGKIAVMLFSAPLENPDFPDYRKRKQALVGAGAWGVLTIIDGKSRWRRFARRYRQSSTGLDGDDQHANVEGMISRKQFDRVIRKTGLFRGTNLVKEANDVDFVPTSLSVAGDLSVETDVRKYQSHNVIGKIPGKRPDAGSVLFLGHWDHFGECVTEDKSNPAKDRLCNGAVDNASGISLLIEVAKRLAASPPDRDIYFLATTAEEQGLLGARAFVRDPAFDISTIVAAFNADTVALSPTGDLIAVVGRGETGLDRDIEKLAKQENREIDKSDKANAFLKRQDGFVFLEQDIPAFMITSAFSDQERLDAYLKGRYHDVSDEADDELVLGGAVDDANFHVALGRYFGSIATYPEKPSSE